MKINVKFYEGTKLRTKFNEDEKIIDCDLSESNQKIEPYFGIITETKVLDNDYSLLENKPSINSIVLDGALTARHLGLSNVYYDTKENWDIQRSIIAEAEAIYIYTNYQYIDDGNGNLTPVAGIKIGDGTSYLIDIPFVSEATSNLILNHISDTSIHTTPLEKEFWNNKVTTYFHNSERENLIFSKTDYVVNGDIKYDD